MPSSHQGNRFLHVHPCPAAGFPAGLLRGEYISRRDRHPDWACILPAQPGDDWVVNLHGHGSRGDQLFTRPDLRDRHLPFFRGKGWGILTPNLRGNAWMGPAAVADLHELLAAVRSMFRVRRFLFVSGSMGGTGNLIYAARHPEDVAAVVALCPATDLAEYVGWLHSHPGGVRDAILSAILASYGGSPDELPVLYRAHSAMKQAFRLGMPVAVSHGLDDPLIPAWHSIRLERALGPRADCLFRYLPSGNHDAPLGDMLTFEWLARTVAS